MKLQITSYTSSKQKTKEKKKVRTLHKHTGLRQKSNMTRWVSLPRLSASTPALFTFCRKKRINCSSEGQYLKEAHFFLKEAILLLSRAICFSISMGGVHNKLYVYL